MQSMPDGNYKFIMNNHDHLTKFCVVESLTSKRAAEVAYKLLKSMFLLFGAPHILQSDNGRGFTAIIITDLKELWPELVIVHGKPCHPQSQGSIERYNGDIHDMLVSWMRDNNSTNWATGIKFVVSEKQARSCRNKAITIRDYVWMCTQSWSINNSYSKVLQKEEDLQAHLNDKPSDNATDNTNSDVNSR
jgi:hypothetical protein